jgi:hypothetical protein
VWWEGFFLYPLTLTEVRGFSPRTIYERRSLSSKKDFKDLAFGSLSSKKDFDFKDFKDFKAFKGLKINLTLVVAKYYLYKCWLNPSTHQ